MKNFLVSWSGGVDSTALIHYLLCNGHHVDAIYINLENNGNKTLKEQVAIESIKPFFEKYDFSYLGEQKFLISVVTSTLWIRQPLLWLNGLVYAVDNNKHDEVSLGYIMNDDAISYINDITTIWNSFGLIMNSSIPPLTFPFSKKKKKEVWDILPEKIQPLVTWCEFPTENQENCGNCAACERHVREIINET